METATCWKHRRNEYLVATYEANQNGLGDLQDRMHGSLSRSDSVAPVKQFLPQGRERCLVRVRPGPDQQIPGALVVLHLGTPDFLEPAPQTITGHRRVMELGNYKPHPGEARGIVGPDQLETGGPAAFPGAEYPMDIGGPPEPLGAIETLSRRQYPPCLEGMTTVSRRRPFLRRRDRIARPQRVAMRARKPCLFTRRRLRGRYVGFINRCLH